MKVVTFGEVMLRLMPQGFTRIRQSVPGSLDATFGGGELNVAVSIAVQGGHSAFVTAIPDNAVSDCLEQEMRRLGVSTDLLHRKPEGRFGIYFVESGANQRAGIVVYDRNATTVSLQPPGAYDWDRIFDGASWFHITGITPAISAYAADSAVESVHQARDRGVTVSCDLNFRRKLWRWQPETPPVHLAQTTMRRMMPMVDVVVSNEEDAELALGITARDSDVESGRINQNAYVDVARQIIEQFPNVRRVAVTLRESLSASHNNWGAMLYEALSGTAAFAPTDADGNYRPYEIRDIVDRVGAGDSFAGALIFALNTPELAEPDSAIRYAAAASCLKHSILGDFNYATRSEIEALMAGSGSGRVQR